MIDKESIIDNALEDWPEDAPYAVEVAVDATIHAMLVYLRDRKRQAEAKPNTVEALVLDSILKEFNNV